MNTRFLFAHSTLVVALLLQMTGSMETGASAAVLRYHWPELQQSGEQAYMLENYPEAHKQFVKARLELEHWGQRNADLAETLNSLGIVSIVLGNYPEAEAYFKRALPMRERYLGPTHQGVAITLFNMSELYRLQGRNPESEAYRQKAYQIDPSVIDSGEVNVAFTSATLNPAGEKNGFNGKYIAPKLRNLPPPTVFGTPYQFPNANVAALTNDQGLSSMNRGMYESAEYKFYLSLHLNERTYGPSHPIIAESLNNIAILYENQGRFYEAEPLYQEALSIQEGALGLSHPDILKTFNNLKQMYLLQGRFDDAERLTQRYFPSPKTINNKFLEETFGINSTPVPRNPNAKTSKDKKKLKKGTKKKASATNKK